MAVVRFAPGRAVELEYGVDADLPHALRDGSLLVADSNFALVFATAQFLLDGDVSTLGEVAGEVSQIPEGDASPLGAGFPGSGVILPGRLGSEREHRDVGCVMATHSDRSVYEEPFRVLGENMEGGRFTVERTGLRLATAAIRGGYDFHAVLKPRVRYT